MAEEIKIYGRNDPKFDGCNFCGQPIMDYELFHRLPTRDLGELRACATCKPKVEAALARARGKQ